PIKPPPPYVDPSSGASGRRRHRISHRPLVVVAKPATSIIVVDLSLRQTHCAHPRHGLMAAARVRRASASPSAYRSRVTTDL
ncbi:hypothetical protein LINPERPRIM_LOCUS31808, partial [Linum perenne]